MCCLVLLGVAGVALRRPEAPTRRYDPLPLRAASVLVNCFYPRLLAPAVASPAVGGDAAEAAARAGYDLPYRDTRLGTLLDTRPVAVGYAARPLGQPTVSPTLEAATRERGGWLLIFAETPALAAPAAPAAFPVDTTAYLLYALVDGASGAVLATCAAAGPIAETVGETLSPPAEGVLRGPFAAARAVVPFARDAGWLPFEPTERFARVEHRAAGADAVVADYFATGGAGTGARVRVISTTVPPALATAGREGQAVALADGHSARFDDLGATQVLTWAEGAVWYQIVAARPPADGAPYGTDELLRIAAGLR